MTTSPDYPTTTDLDMLTPSELRLCGVSLLLSTVQASSAGHVEHAHTCMLLSEKILRMIQRHPNMPAVIAPF